MPPALNRVIYIFLFLSPPKSLRYPYNADSLLNYFHNSHGMVYFIMICLQCTPFANFVLVMNINTVCERRHHSLIPPSLLCEGYIINFRWSKQPCKKYGSTGAALAARLEPCRQVHLLWLVKSYITKKRSTF